MKNNNFMLLAILATALYVGQCYARYSCVYAPTREVELTRPAFAYFATSQPVVSPAAVSPSVAIPAPQPSQATNPLAGLSGIIGQARPGYEAVPATIQADAPVQLQAQGVAQGAALPAKLDGGNINDLAAQFGDSDFAELVKNASGEGLASGINFKSIIGFGVVTLIALGGVAGITLSQSEGAKNFLRSNLPELYNKLFAGTVQAAGGPNQDQAQLPQRGFLRRLAMLPRMIVNALVTIA